MLWACKQKWWKKRQHETLTNANFKVLNRNESYCLTTSVYFWNNHFLNWYKTHFLWRLKKRKKYFAITKLLVCLKVPYWTHYNFFASKWKMPANFKVLHSSNYLFVTTSVQFSVKNPEFFFINGKKNNIIFCLHFFILFNRAPLSTLNFVLAK